MKHADDEPDKDAGGPEAEVVRLTLRLAELEQAFRALTSGEIDSAAEGAGLAPVLLRSAQQELRESQRRFAAIFECSADGIILFDDAGKYLEANRAACELLGFTREELLGKTVGALLSDPDDGPRILKSVVEARSLEGESELATGTGERRTFSFRAVAHILPGLHMSMFRDVTEIRAAQLAERRAEQRFRALLDSAPDAMLLVDSAGTIVLINRRLEILFGYEREELIGAPLDRLVPDTVRARHAGHLDRYMASPDHRVMGAGRELLARRKDGTELEVEITLSPLRDEDGGLNVIAAVRDVTERNRLRDQLLVSDRMASVGMLAAGVAHEINNPLASVIANMDLILEEGPVEHFDELRDAREAAERVRSIVRDLRIFSRGEAEQLRPVDVHRVMDSTLRMAWNEIRHRARLVKDYGRTPPVRANDSRLGQVFLNLIMNAAQAIPEGRTESNQIRVTTSLDPAGWVVVTITDTGIGIPPEIYRRLFTPFLTTKPIGQGTGLGLSICQRIVTDLGGRITVESKVGEGSTFRVHLPVADAETVDVEEHPPPAPSVRRGRVLVIDDEEVIAQTAARVLSRQHDVTVLTDAEAALEKIGAGERFDVILCDLMMPQMTGMDLHAELIATEPEQASRMIFMTGGAFTARAREYLDNAPNLRLEKPFDIQQLRAVVNEKVR